MGGGVCAEENGGWVSSTKMLEEVQISVVFGVLKQGADDVFPVCESTPNIE